MNTPAAQPAPVPPDPRLPSTEVEPRHAALANYQQPPGQMATAWLTPTSLQSALVLAELMAKCRLVPQHLQGSISDCVLVLSQAARWGMDPFAVAQATAVVKGKLCFEGKLVAAALVATGAVEGGLDYEFTGDGQDMSIVVTGIVARTGKSRSLPGSVRQWRTPNDQWDKDPMSMLVYRGTRQWCRLFTPETILGVYTPDELEEAREVVVTGTEPANAKDGIVPDAQAPKARRSKLPATPPVVEAQNAATPTGQEQVASNAPAPAATPAAPPPPAAHQPPDPRLAILLAEGKFLQDSGPLGTASVRAVLQQLGVTKPQNVLASRLDEAIQLIRNEAKVCGVTLPPAAAKEGA